MMKPKENIFEEMLKGFAQIAQNYERENKLPFETIYMEQMKTYFTFSKN